jgi:signal transduction histidine kinase
MALGDESTVDPVIGQLVENAIKYCPEGCSIDVTVRGDGPDAVLRVGDRGRGIAESDLDRVFDRFVRAAAEPEARPSVGGAGLGLYIVRRYVEAQGGRVVAHRRDGGGTVIEVRLPGC